MADILFFRARPRNQVEAVERSAEGAKILFFTGVRYMRIEDADLPIIAARKAPSRAGKPKTPRRPPRKRA